jgi:hypothetical protein
MMQTKGDEFHLPAQLHKSRSIQRGGLGLQQNIIHVGFTAVLSPYDVGVYVDINIRAQRIARLPDKRGQLVRKGRVENKLFSAVRNYPVFVLTALYKAQVQQKFLYLIGVLPVNKQIDIAGFSIGRPRIRGTGQNRAFYYGVRDIFQSVKNVSARFIAHGRLNAADRKLPFELLAVFAAGFYARKKIKAAMPV